MTTISLQRILEMLASGFHVRWQRVVLVFLVNTAVSMLLSVDDERPFIHPFITVQTAGFAIGYFVNCFKPWQSKHPHWVLTGAVTLGTLLGLVVNIVLKIEVGLYTIAYYQKHAAGVIWSTFWTGQVGWLVSMLFITQMRESHNREALQAVEVERQRLSRQAIEAELRLMQAQVEPHFLFNTLSNVQFLVETNPPAAARMLDHLTGYLRAAIPQIRQQHTTLGQEAKLADSYLAILQMRMGRRLQYRMEIPPELAVRDIPPMMLLSLVENAIKHGVEPAADGGEIVVSATSDAGSMHIVVSDTGRGLVGTPGTGVGLSNIRERLHALYGEAGRLTLEENQPHGVIATMTIPEKADD
ncbi:MAG: histidine kinase [Burkholderiales bacterium]|nr:histidine kinase [Burkholderiales bacterium]